MRQVYAFLFLLLPLSILAQGQVRGRIVSGEKDIPLPGVSVYVKGTNNGTISNGNGYFILDVANEGKVVLVFSSVGYQKIEQGLDVSGEVSLNDLSMIEDAAELNEVVISGGKNGMDEIPGSVQYLSPRELAKFNYTDVNRTLRTLPGVNLQEEDGFGLRPNIGLRGTGVERSSKITVMEDGVLMAPAPYVAPAAYYFPTIGRMSGVEVLKGSSQIKYGPYTTGGALNLISTPIPSAFSGNLALIYGTFNTSQLHANVGNAHEHLAYMVETFQYSSDGFKQLDGGGNTGFEKTDFLGKIRVNTGEEAKLYQSLTMKVGRSDEVSNETYLGLSQDDFDLNPNRRYAASQEDQMNAEHAQYSLTHLIRFNENIDLVTTIYRNEFKRNWYKLDKVTDSSGNKVSISSILDDPDTYENAFGIIEGRNSDHGELLHVKANNREYFSQGVQTQLNYRFETSSIRHLLTAGLRLHRDGMDRFQWVDDYSMNDGKLALEKAGIPGTESNRIQQADALAAYVQYRMKIGRFDIIPGLRYESISMWKDDYGKNDVDRSGGEIKRSENVVDVIIPGIGADYRINRSMNAFVGVHKGFAPPGTTEGSLPEESINYEAGMRYRQGSLSWTVVAFYNDYSNLLGADLNAAGGTGSNELFNGGRAESRGLEIELSYDLLSFRKVSRFTMPLSLAYTYTSSRFLSDFDSDFDAWGSVNKNDELPYLAPHQLSLMLGLEHSAFSLQLSGRYMDRMRTEAGQGDIPGDEVIPSYIVVDASVSFRAHRNLSIFTSVTNVADRSYAVSRRPAGIRPGLPRAFNLGVKANF